MKLNKPYTNQEYVNLIVYCNDNNCRIEDCGEYLQSVANPPAPRPSKDIIVLQRQARFRAEADPLKYDYEEALARGTENIEQLKQQWLSKKDEIRASLPYPEELANV